MTFFLVGVSVRCGSHSQYGFSGIGEEQSILIKQCFGIPESYLGWPDPSCHGVLVDG